MGLYDDLRTQKYLDPVYGTVSNLSYGDATNGFNCNNPSLFTAEASTILGWQFVGWPQYPQFLLDAMVTPGLYRRYPGCNSNTSQDETLAQATISSLAAQTILEYGRKHWWVFQPQGGEFQWGSWLGRFVWLRPYVKFCAVFRMNWFDQILWSACCMASPFSAYSDTSGKLLFWVMSRFIMKANGKPWLCKQAIRFWNWRMAGKYESPQELFEVYFGSVHPFVKYAPSNWK